MLMSCIRTDAGIGSDIFLQQRLNLLLHLEVELCSVCSVLTLQILSASVQTSLTS